ncbi:host cell division inhibitor Icd-like protein [Pantoea sp. R102]|nr:host cell division inhibitor Icd-like protein [Pantoea sp. R102]
MAVNKHTQTHPKYQHRLPAISRQDRSVPPLRLCTGAGSEQAVRCLALSPADPLPVQEAQNA